MCCPPGWGHWGRRRLNSGLARNGTHHWCTPAILTLDLPGIPCFQTSSICKAANKKILNNFPCSGWQGVGWASFGGMFSFLSLTTFARVHGTLGGYFCSQATSYFATCFLLIMLLSNSSLQVYHWLTNHPINWLNLNSTYSLLQHFTQAIYCFSPWSWLSWLSPVSGATCSLPPAWSLLPFFSSQAKFSPWFAPWLFSFLSFPILSSLVFLPLPTVQLSPLWEWSLNLSLALTPILKSNSTFIIA